jgi:hypothetical protein
VKNIRKRMTLVVRRSRRLSPVRWRDFERRPHRHQLADGPGAVLPGLPDSGPNSRRVWAQPTAGRHGSARTGGRQQGRHPISAESSHAMAGVACRRGPLSANSAARSTAATTRGWRHSANSRSAAARPAGQHDLPHHRNWNWRRHRDWTDNCAWVLLAPPANSAIRRSSGTAPCAAAATAVVWRRWPAVRRWCGEGVRLLQSGLAPFFSKWFQASGFGYAEGNGRRGSRRR